MDINPTKSKLIFTVPLPKRDFTSEETDLVKVLATLLNASTGLPSAIRIVESLLGTTSLRADVLTQLISSMEQTRYFFPYLSNLCHLHFSLMDHGIRVTIEPHESSLYPTAPSSNFSHTSPTWISSRAPVDISFPTTKSHQKLSTPKT